MVRGERHEHLCPRCGYNTVEIGAFKRHLQRRTLCDPLLSDNDLVHTKEQYLVSKEKQFKCQECNKAYHTKTGLNYHSNKEHKKAAHRHEHEHEHEDKSEKNDLQNINASLKQKVQDLELALRLAKEDKREDTYQRLLEKYCFPGASHLKIACGVTDITTDTLHAEIKRFEYWKDAIGQLSAYNIDLPRSELHVYLFGKYSEACKQKAVYIIQQLHIHPFEVKVVKDEFIVLDLKNGTEQRFNLKQPDT